MLEKIISGGQTGVDRAALDAAKAAGLHTGGWCPKGRKAEDGPIPERYLLQETPESDYETRTAWNVRDADATLILSTQPLTSGTKLTAGIAESTFHKPLHIANPKKPDVEALRAWLQMHQVKVLNVAGPRESKSPGAYQSSCDFLANLFMDLRTDRLSIDNCEFSKACSKRWSELTPMHGMPRARHCGDCQKPVFLCTTDEELQWHAGNGHCIALPETPARLPPNTLGTPRSRFRSR